MLSEPQFPHLWNEDDAVGNQEKLFREFWEKTVFQSYKAIDKEIPYILSVFMGGSFCCYTLECDNFATRNYSF